MKKVILSLALVAFALAPLAQAGEAKKADKDCAGKDKVACTEKSACCAKTTVKKLDMSVKGAELLVRK